MITLTDLMTVIPRSKRCICLLAVLGANWLGAAEPAAEPAAKTPPATPDAAAFAGNAAPGLRYMRLGELALENLDHTAAAEFFAQALPGLEDPELRRMCYDLHHECLLNINDLNAADNLYLQARTAPEFANDTIQLETMAARRALADGKTAEAIAKLRPLTVGIKTTEECRRALELQAIALNQAGDFDGAAKAYADLAVAAGEVQLWSFKALEGAALNALDAQDHRRAQSLYARIPLELTEDLQHRLQNRINKLRILIEASQGEFDKISPEFQQLTRASRVPDTLLARIAAAGAETAAGRMQFTQAANLWQQAFKFADMRFKPLALKGLINVQISGALKADALKTIFDYLKLFPAAKDQSEMRLLAAGLCNELNDTKQAQTLYSQVFDNLDCPLNLRCDAAVELAKLYQRNGDANNAAAMYKFAISNAADTASRNPLQQTLGEYLYSLGRYQEALKIFAEIERTAADKKPQEWAGLWQVQTLYQLKDFAAALKICQRLTNAAEPEVRRKISYLKALQLDRLNQFGDAIREYLNFARNYKKSPEAPTALFQAGELATRTPQYSAPEIFMAYARNYPGENAANALYKAYNGFLQDNNPTEANKILSLLDKQYPNSKYTIGAHFRKVDFLRESQQYAEAVKALDAQLSTYAAKDAQLQSELWYHRALLYKNQNDFPKMLAALNEIVSHHADKPVAAQAFFMLGDLKLENGEFQAAAAAFRQAEERRPGGDFAAACAGRAADAVYGLYASSRDVQYLQQAAASYENLLKLPTLSAAFKFQTLYKLGRCRSEAKDFTGALNLYREELYLAVMAKRQNRYYAPAWSAKTLQAAVNLLLTAAGDAEPAEALALRNEAVKLLNLARELQLPGEDIEAQLQKLRSENQN